MQLIDELTNLTTQKLPEGMHGFPVVNAVCNSTGYTHLKVYCDQTSSDIKTQFVTKSLSTLRVLHHLKLSTCGRHWLERCSRTLK